ncbi:hypothetical protein ACIBI4_26110 [Streptomyces sp. NPDC050418]|uniref:hypothetical protein n=1 Tax=Streptomyces sp. NPDC050418 TaxID=3365612 RepID=UPI003789095C
MNPLTPHMRGAFSGAALLLIPLVVVVGSDGFRAALDFTTGVLSLVSLTCSIAWGLVASDRLFLSPRQRLIAQGVHRATAMAALGFLLLHGTVKLVLGHVSAVGALIPFGLGVTGTDGLIGFGSLAGLLMITTGVTGVLRSSFASPARIAGRWRALHMLAYPAWCAALVHGLYAGRAPKPWVLALYCLCLAGVTGALALRAAPLPVKRKVAARVLALLDAQTAPVRGEPVGTPRREGPLPGMDALPPSAEPAASRPQLPSQPRRLPPAYEGPQRVAAEEPRRYAEESLLGEERSRAGDSMAAAYRAVSTAPGARPVPLPDTAFRDTGLPEFPEEHGGRWPTPSPPPPGEAARPPVAAPQYGTGPQPVVNGEPVPGSYGTGPIPAYDTEVTAPSVPTPVPSSEAPFYVTSDPYDTGSMPPYGVGPISPYDTGVGPISPYDTGADRTPLHEAPTETFASPVTGPVVSPLASPVPNPVASPFEAPSAGEPWSAPGAPSTGGRR